MNDSDRGADAEPAGAFPRYAAVAPLAACFVLVTPVVLHEWVGLGERFAVAVTLLGAFALNFVLARGFVFRARGAWRPQVVRFALVSAACRLGEYLAFLALYSILALHYVAAVAVVMVVSFVAKFFVYRALVFERGDAGAAQ